MRRLLILFTVLFGAFIAWIIFLADAGRDSVFFRFARSLPLGDKLGHCFLFGVLSFGLNLSLRLKTFRLGRLKVPLGPAVLLILVVGEEFSQALFPSRTVDAGDLLADLLGITVFTALSLRPALRRRFGPAASDEPKAIGPARDDS